MLVVTWGGGHTVSVIVFYDSFQSTLLMSCRVRLRIPGRWLGHAMFCGCRDMEVLDSVMSKGLPHPGQLAQLVGGSFPAQKGFGFDSQPGYMPRFQVQSPLGASMRSN